MLRSLDGGHWEAIDAGISTALTAITFADQQNGWAVGHDAVVLHSSDGGETWQEQYRDPEFEAPLLNAWFENPRHGFAIGAYGLCLETHDGGASWQPRDLDEAGPHFYAMAAVAESTVVMVGEFGTLLRSRDFGATWETLESPYEGTFFGLLPIEPGAFLVYGLRGHLFRTDDTGNSWRRVETDTELSIYDGAITADRIVLVGAGGLWLESRDQGNSFHSRELWRLRSLSAIQPREPSDRAVVAGELGVFTRRSPLEEATKAP